MSKQKLFSLTILTVALLIIFGLLLFRLDEPMFGHREGAVVWIAATVRMYNQYGMDALNYLPIRTMGPATPEGVYYYLHHPPLSVWWTAWATWLFGYDTASGTPYESSIRAGAILVTMPTLCLLYALAKRLTNQKSALIAFFLYSLTPMNLYFGRTPIFDFMVLPFVLAFCYVFVGWMHAYSRRGTFLMCILAILSVWVAWAGTPTLAALGIVGLIYGSKRQRFDIFVIGVVIASATVAIPVVYELLRHGAVAAIVTIFLYRLSNKAGGADSSDFTLLQFLGVWLKDLMTVVSLALSGFGFWGMGLMLRRRDLKAAICLALVAGPFAFILLLRNAFYFHDWYEVAYMPGFAIIAGWVIYRAWLLPPDGIKRFVKPFVVAICVSSLGISIYWTVLLHQYTLNPFSRALAAELPLYTEAIPYEAGTYPLASNINVPYDEVEYNAYRNITWGVSLETLEAYFAEHETVRIDYLYCPSDKNPEAYTGSFAEFPYEIVAERCRLMHVRKGE